MDVAHPWDGDGADPERDIDKARRHIHMHTGWDAEHLLMAPPEMHAMMVSGPMANYLRMMPSLGPGAVIITEMRGISIHLERSLVCVPYLQEAIYLMGGTALLVNGYPERYEFAHLDQPCMGVVLRGLTKPRRLRVRLPRPDY